MFIKVSSALTGKTRFKDIDVTSNQIENWKGGTLIQYAMPDVCEEDRDFIKGLFWDELGWDKV